MNKKQRVFMKCDKCGKKIEGTVAPFKLSPQRVFCSERCMIYWKNKEVQEKGK